MNEVDKLFENYMEFLSKEKNHDFDAASRETLKKSFVFAYSHGFIDGEKAEAISQDKRNNNLNKY